MVTKYIQQRHIESKQELIQKNKDKLSNWLMLRKEEYVLKAKDSSELDAIKEQYAAETDFKQKIALKKQMESLEQQQKQMMCQKDLSGIMDVEENYENQYDHIVPLEDGGLNDVSNMQLMCSKCNQEKGIQTYTNNIYHFYYDN